MVVTMTDRGSAREAFLARAGYDNRAMTALPTDCSFRRYYRLAGEPSLLLMDAPPPDEDIRPYILVGRYLRTLGFSVPRIVAANEAAGFALIEDFGNSTYMRLLDSNGADERRLYELAVDVLVALQNRAKMHDINVPFYSEQRLLDEVVLLPDWYLPLMLGHETPAVARARLVDAWRSVLALLPPSDDTLVLRDFHADNLMLLSTRRGLAGCGLLDFQDAVVGHPAYDLVSLLEDSRRNMSDVLRRAMLTRYFTARPSADTVAFRQWYTVLGGQRQTKVAGIFARQYLRDGKAAYLSHLPRVRRLLARSFAEPMLAPVAAWCAEWLPAKSLIPDAHPVRNSHDAP